MLSGVGPLLAAVKMRQNLLVTDVLRCDFSEHRLRDGCIFAVEIAAVASPRRVSERMFKIAN